MNGFFDLSKQRTSYKQEILAGLTTFFTMSYIIVVNPAILSAAGMPKGASMVATILTAILGTLIMGFYAKRPFAIASYMGENVFIAYTVVLALGHSWQTALGAIFISGVIFTLLTVLKLRTWLAEAIPKSLKFSFAVGIGLFLAFLGLQDMGVVSLGVEGAPVKLANLTKTTTLLSIFGLFLTVALVQRKVPGAILIGILTVTGIAFGLSLLPMPSAFVSPPPDISPVFLQLDISGALSGGFISVIISVLVMDFVDTMGSLIGLSARANLLDNSGNLAEIEKPMLADALATIGAALFGTTTAGVFIESASGIEAGGRTGLTAIVVALMFGLALFFAPIFTVIPAYAYGPALVIVGMMMLESVKHINFKDYTEVFPAFLTIILMIYTFNIGVGLTSGFIAFPILKILSGRGKEVSAGMWGLCLVSIAFYFLYPYH